MRQIGTQTGRERDSERERETDRERDRDGERERGRERERVRQTEREKERETSRQTERKMDWLYIISRGISDHPPREEIFRLNFCKANFFLQEISFFLLKKKTSLCNFLDAFTKIIFPPHVKIDADTALLAFNKFEALIVLLKVECPQLIGFKKMLMAIHFMGF